MGKKYLSLIDFFHFNFLSLNLLVKNFNIHYFNRIRYFLIMNELTNERVNVLKILMLNLEIINR